MRAREYRHRYKEKRLSLVSDKNSLAPECFSLKTLQDVQTQRVGGASKYIQVGDMYEAKSALMHEVCEMA